MMKTFGFVASFWLGFGAEAMVREEDDLASLYEERCGYGIEKWVRLNFEICFRLPIVILSPTGAEMVRSSEARHSRTAFCQHVMLDASWQRRMKCG
jgi:hypothetical protein